MIRNTMDFGALVRHRRLTRRLTQREPALVAGVGERFVVDLENGKATAQLGKALAVAAALGIELEDRLRSRAAARGGRHPRGGDSRGQGWRP